MKLLDAVVRTIEATGSGASADAAAKALLVNVLQDEMPFQPIELKEPRHLLPMMRDADRPHIYGEASTFYFTAHYSYSEDFPIGRSYFIRATDMFEISRLHQFFREADLRLPIIAPKERGALIAEEGFRDRIQVYKARKKIELAPFKGLVEGREGAKTVSHSIFLNSPGCLMCGRPQFVMLTCTLNSGAGTMVGFNLCPEHLEESQKFNSLIEYLADRLNHALPVKVQPLDSDSHFSRIVGWLPIALSARVEKIDCKTITLRRDSKFKLIFRLDELFDYAYMMYDPNGVQVARFDSADHHKVAYGPDHLHPNLPADKTARPSFSTGTPLIDLNGILDILEAKERDFERRT